MGPVLARAQRQLAPPLHDENTGVADIPRSLLARQKETVLKLVLILVTVSETGAGKEGNCYLSVCVLNPRVCLSHLLDLALQMQQPSNDL